MKRKKRVCKNCEGDIINRANNAEYCKECSVKRRKEDNKERSKRYQQEHKEELLKKNIKKLKEELKILKDLCEKEIDDKDKEIQRLRKEFWHKENTISDLMIVKEELKEKIKEFEERKEERKKNSDLCPLCSNKTKVIDKRSIKGVLKRRRECIKCKKRFNTIEVLK